MKGLEKFKNCYFQHSGWACFQAVGGQKGGCDGVILLRPSTASLVSKRGSRQEGDASACFADLRRRGIDTPLARRVERGPGCHAGDVESTIDVPGHTILTRLDADRRSVSTPSFDTRRRRVSMPRPRRPTPVGRRVSFLSRPLSRTLGRSACEPQPPPSPTLSERQARHSPRSVDLTRPSAAAFWPMGILRP